MSSFVVFDFETANNSRASVCSLGMVKFTPEGQVLDTYSQLIKPHPQHAEFLPRNMSIHHITPAEVANAPEWGAAVDNIRRFVGSSPMVCHNISFDRACLQQVNELYEVEPFTNSMYCTLQAATTLLPHLPRKTLDALFRHYYSAEEFRHHDALEDALATAKIFGAMAADFGLQAVLDAGRSMRPAPKGSATSTNARPRRPATAAPGPLAPKPGSPLRDAFIKYEDTPLLAGHSITLTGKLSDLTRAEFTEFVAKLGGRYSSSVNGATTIFIEAQGSPGTWRPGAGGSRKLCAAQERIAAGQRITLLNEEQFCRLLHQLGESAG